MGLLFTTIIFLFFFKPKNFIFRYKKELNIIFLFLLIYFLEWFYNHPSLRYGGYSIFALTIFIPLSIFLSNQSFNYKKNLNKINTIVAITLIIFCSRNIIRMLKEIERAYKEFIRHL